MILDARDESVDLDREAQIVIVGAGPSGLFLASELAGSARTLVIESGGFENDPDLQAILAGECAGIDYPLSETRTRQFGGSTALWAGYCALFDPQDFTRREWIPGSGWPFGIGEIEPYYERTARLLNVDDLNFDPRDIAENAGVSLPFDTDTLVPTVWRFGTPTLRIDEHLRGKFGSSPDVTTLIHANVVDIRLDPEHAAVNELVIRTLDGREGRISADIFVLACGGLETPRVLLNADSQVRHGLGNSSDMVGRSFMEHPHLSITSLKLQETHMFRHWVERGSYDGDGQFVFCTGLSAEVQEEAKIMNARAHIYRTPDMGDDEIPKVGVFFEQAPNPDSRVTLSGERDSLGMRRIRLDWQLTDLDWKTYERTMLIMQREFERINAGRVSGQTPLATRDNSLILYSNHHLGTTRMSSERHDGVVDPQCRVHDYSNLYIAGGSVFPSVSWANPTFTVISLVLRLAGHLRSIIEPDSQRA